MTSINDLEFRCTSCGRMHNVLDWVSRYKLDDEWIYESLSEDGRLRLSIPYVECECGAEYIVDIEQGYVTIYNDGSEMIYEEGYSVKE